MPETVTSAAAPVRLMRKNTATQILAGAYVGPALHSRNRYQAGRTDLSEVLARLHAESGRESAARLALDALGYVPAAGLESIGGYRARLLLSASRRAAMDCLRASARDSGRAHAPERAVAGLPTAKGFLPPGTPGEVCVDYNRACKAARIAIIAIRLGYGPDITDAQIDACADQAGARRPGGQDTRNAVRAALEDPIDALHSSNKDAFHALMDSARDGHPLQVVTYRGRRVLMVPVPTA